MFKVFQASSPDVEVDGRTGVAVVNGMLIRSVARELLTWSGMSIEALEGWMPWQPWLDLYRNIYQSLGPDTLYFIGRRIPYSAEFPGKTMADVPTALQAINVAYHQAHRGGEIGSYRFARRGADHYQVHCDNPYPNEFDLGIVTSLVERYRGRSQYRVRMGKRPGKLWDNGCVLDVQQVI